MSGRRRRAKVLIAIVVALIAAKAIPLAADAHWLTKIVRESGEAGGRVGKLGLGALDNAAGFLAKLPATGRGTALAAHATPEGHWKFANRQGEVFTAATPDEMARVVNVLEPAAASDSMLTLYLSEDTIFAQRGALKDLPPRAELHVVVDREAYRLRPRATPNADALFAEVRPNLVVELGERRLFEETVYHLGRHLNRSDIRVLALEPGGPRILSSVPNYDPATKAALVDPIDPAVLGPAFGKLKGQTVLVTGRVEGDLLYFKPVKGPESNIALAMLGRAAEAADVSLVVLQSSVARQPGGRNWLWQTVSVSGLDDALKRATFGDFLNALGAGRGELVVSARPSAAGRVTLTANPSGASAVPMTDAVSNWFSDTAGELVGNVVVQGVQAFMPDRARAEELDARIIPGVPSWIQAAYLAGLIGGLIGWAFSLAWWSRIWPPEQREEYGNPLGYHLARAVRLLALFLIFLPLVGIPAVLAALAVQLWRMLTAPLRWFRWLKGKAGFLARPQPGRST